MGDYGNVFSIERGQQNMTSFDRDFYKEYLSSKDLSGFISKGEATGWYGAHPELDERTKQTISAYSLYYIRNIVDFRSNVGIVILDVSKQFVMEALKESNLPKGSTAAFITADGYETVYSEDADIPSIKESGFLHILEDEKDQNQGYYYGEYEGRKYMFLYSRVDISDSYFCALIPESIMTMQVEFLKVMTNIGILIGAVIAMAVGLSISRGFGNAITMTNEVLAKAAKGDLNVHIHQNRKDEFGTISENINNMLDTVRKATEQEKEAILKSKEAEIRSLEAQINPHFLYNTLDAINWVAIDQGALEASKMITNLADNLRYSIKNSNEVVTISREVEYLRKYLQLQQKRFRYLFECILDVDDEVMEEPIHKMLLQPLIENAIEHAFIGREDNNEIVISIKKSEKGLLIQVDDNGIGMNHDLVEQLNRYDYLKDRIESNIGLRNVATRLKMYYGEECHMHIDSSEKGTKISILIPY
jgi:two-component system sensor histidine kinase YesM